MGFGWWEGVLRIALRHHEAKDGNTAKSELPAVSGGRPLRLGGHHRWQGPRCGCREQGWLLLGEAARRLCPTAGWATGHPQGCCTVQIFVLFFTPYYNRLL